MDSAGLLMSELDWLSTSLDRDLATETLATLIPTPAASDHACDEVLADPSRGERTALLTRVAGFLRGCRRPD